MTDILSDNFDETYLRWDREYSVAIVDEVKNLNNRENLWVQVDSMFLDGRKDSARLSSPSFGMEYLIGTLSYIWKEVNSNLEMVMFFFQYETWSPQKIFPLIFINSRRFFSLVVNLRVPVSCTFDSWRIK